MGVSIVTEVPKMDGLQGKIPLKWMIWGYLYFKTPPYRSFSFIFLVEFRPASSACQRARELKPPAYVQELSVGHIIAPVSIWKNHASFKSIEHVQQKPNVLCLFATSTPLYMVNQNTQKYRFWANWGWRKVINQYKDGDERLEFE